jgi:NADH-quinone oxidoreductase subunit I
MKLTLEQMLRKKDTRQYPEERWTPPPSFRGAPVLVLEENGVERCIGCALCAAACPADAIYVEPAENTDAERYSPGERYAKTYEINMLRCIFCGYCEDACPTDAIVLTDAYELSADNRRDLIFTKDMLILPPPPGKAGTPQQAKEGSYPRSILPEGLVSEP